MLRPSTSTSGTDPLICRSPAFEKILAESRRAARSDLTVLLTGETGTGKGRLARDIHAHSPRSKRPFVVWSACEGSESLAAGALFGHVRGSFTGADRDVVGILESADTGTLVIDDVDKMPAFLQGQLLRFLDGREIRRVGASGMRWLDLRLVVTTNRVLPELADQRLFLPDLMWRLTGLKIRVPPLRERREDIAELVDHYLVHFARCLRVETPRLSRGALDALVGRPWPGNIREVEAAMENLVFRAPADGEIQAADVRRETGGSGDGKPRREGYGPRDARLSAESLARAMEMAQGNGVRAAALLGVPLRSVRRWLARYGMSHGPSVVGGSNGHGNGAAKVMGNGH